MLRIQNFFQEYQSKFMSSAAYLRQYYQGRASKEIKLEPQVSSSVYDQTVKYMAQMISIVKQLLEKIARIKETLQSDKVAEDVELVNKQTGQLRQLQTEIGIALSSKRELDQKYKSDYLRMAGPFTFRLCKEINYWRFVLPFALGLITEIESKFEEQKKTEAYSLETICTLSLNKISHNANQLIKALKSRITEKEKAKERKRQENQRRQTECNKENRQDLDDIDRYINELKKSHNGRSSPDLIQQYHIKEKAKEKIVLKKRMLMLEMDNCIYKLYKGLDVKSLQAMHEYCCDLTEKQNEDLISKQQKIRNKRIRKDIKTYSVSYQKFAKKRISHHSMRPTLLLRRSSSKLHNQKQEIKTSYSKKREVTFNKEQLSEPKPIKYKHITNVSRKQKLNVNNVSFGRMGRSLTISNKSLKKSQNKSKSTQQYSKSKGRQLVDISNKKPLKILR